MGKNPENLIVFKINVQEIHRPN